MPAELPVAPPADRATLLRRATFDLTGLPPTPEEIDADDRDPQTEAEAFANVVDRLLASPHYGERMAQQWPTSFVTPIRPASPTITCAVALWRYRDCVVRTLYEDMLYDQLRCPRADRRRWSGRRTIDPNNSDLLVATGFLRMGPWELTAMEVAKIARQRFLDVVTNCVEGEIVLAHSLQCCRCHDPIAFDPVPTRGTITHSQAVFAGRPQLAERARRHSSVGEYPAGDPKSQVSGASAGRIIWPRSRWLWTRNRLKASEEWFAGQEASSHPLAKWRRAKGAVSRRRRNLPRKHSARYALRACATAPRSRPPADRYFLRLLGLTPKEIGLERIANKGLERLPWEFELPRAVCLSRYDAGAAAERITGRHCPLADGVVDPFTPRATQHPCVHIAAVTCFQKGRRYATLRGVERARRLLQKTLRSIALWIPRDGARISPLASWVLDQGD